MRGAEGTDGDDANAKSLMRPPRVPFGNRVPPLWRSDPHVRREIALAIAIGLVPVVVEALARVHDSVDAPVTITTLALSTYAYCVALLAYTTRAWEIEGATAVATGAIGAIALGLASINASGIDRPSGAEWLVAVALFPSAVFASLYLIPARGRAS